MKRTFALIVLVACMLAAAPAVAQQAVLQDLVFKKRQYAPAPSATLFDQLRGGCPVATHSLVETVRCQKRVIRLRYIADVVQEQRGLMTGMKTFCKPSCALRLHEMGRRSAWNLETLKLEMSGLVRRWPKVMIFVPRLSSAHLRRG